MSQTVSEKGFGSIWMTTPHIYTPLKLRWGGKGTCRYCADEEGGQYHVSIDELHEEVARSVEVRCLVEECLADLEKDVPRSMLETGGPSGIRWFYLENKLLAFWDEIVKAVPDG